MQLDYEGRGHVSAKDEDLKAEELDGEDDDDIMALASEKEPTSLEPLPTTVIPIKDRKEFVCNRCHLVKARVQLADEERGLCRDCV